MAAIVKTIASPIGLSIFLLVCGAQPASSVNCASDIEKGKRLFESATCSSCHPGGENLLHPNKPLKGKDFLARYKSDADIEKVIRNGVIDTGMPAFSKQQLSDADLKLILKYIHSLSAASSSKTPSLHGILPKKSKVQRASQKKSN
jgi:mono/diheme cytochrome c family protein